MFILVDEPDRADLRASALRTALPDVRAAEHLVAIGWTAAWIHGALDSAPWQHEMCVRADERASVRLAPRFVQRELRLRDYDEVLIAGLRVTTPRRTLHDLTRRSAHSPGFSSAEQRLARLVTGIVSPR
ncbi:hypothetical protein GCM10011313_08830 [Mycetocola zhadangensis]|nr:hypothetical protein GCM10011313_08830 [Mycetocola zhadangensis]